MRNQTAPEQTWTILSLVQWTTAYFKSNGIESPRVDAEILLGHALGLRRIDLYLRYDQPLHPDELSCYKRLIKRRVQREPVAYITETREFWALDHRVSPCVLIPRPETECLIEAALLRLPPGAGMRVLELGTGSGAISIALASERPRHRYFATDRSQAAIHLARENAGRQEATLPISFFAADWFHPIHCAAAFHMILSNPPYIRSGDIEGLQPEIRQYEPRTALDGGPDGLRCIEHILAHAHRYLTPDGLLLLEMGHDQREAVQAIVHATAHYEPVSFFKDYSGHDRGVILAKSS